jgi:hypothetical protein
MFAGNDISWGAIVTLSGSENCVQPNGLVSHEGLEIADLPLRSVHRTSGEANRNDVAAVHGYPTSVKKGVIVTANARGWEGN